jgi:hypothetical protein
MQSQRISAGFLRFTQQLFNINHFIAYPFSTTPHKINTPVCHLEPFAKLRIHSTKSLAVRFFALLSMTWLKGYIVKYTSDL